MTEQGEATTGFRIKPWMVILVVILLIGAIGNAVLPDNSPCEKDWRANRSTSAVGHDEYIRNCKAAPGEIDKLLRSGK